MRNGTKKYKIAAVSVVLLMVFSSFALVQATSDDSEASSDSWTCTITVSGNSITTKYAKNGAALSDTTPVSGNNGNASVGSWGFDSKTGYGPFGSFYAAFDVNTGKIAYHLNPSDLSKALDGTSVSATGYNIMWVLPTVWMKVTDVVGKGNSTLTMSSEKFSGATAPAHTIDGVVYEYLALGVYEAYDDGSKLYSYSGQSPSNSNLSTFQDHARNTAVYGGHSIVWNYYQYQLYRFCSLAVMENFDSQAQIGNGNVKGGSVLNTGTTMDKGPYYGTSGTTTAERLFIENAWGNVCSLIGDAYFSNGLYVGQNSSQRFATTDGLTPSGVAELSWGATPVFGQGPYSTDLSSWGLPTNCSTDNSASAPDRIKTSSSKGVLSVGGFYHEDRPGYAGLTYIENIGRNASEDVGTRLAMVFDTNPTAKVTVGYYMDGGSPQIASASIQKGDYTISDAAPAKKGYIFIGWYDGTKMLNPGDKISVNENITLSAVWAAVRPVTPSDDSGPNVPGKNLRP